MMQVRGKQLRGRKKQNQSSTASSPRLLEQVGPQTGDGGAGPRLRPRTRGPGKNLTYQVDVECWRCCFNVLFGWGYRALNVDEEGQDAPSSADAAPPCHEAIGHGGASRKACVKSIAKARREALGHDAEKMLLG
jgi:hypothetical protein